MVSIALDWEVLGGRVLCGIGEIVNVLVKELESDCRKVGDLSSIETALKNIIGPMGMAIWQEAKT